MVILGRLRSFTCYHGRRGWGHDFHIFRGLGRDALLQLEKPFLKIFPRKVGQANGNRAPHCKPEHDQVKVSVRELLPSTRKRTRSPTKKVLTRVSCRPCPSMV